jgi:Uma2 family endonuclease
VATTALISIEDYLGNTSFNPDVEFIDGELKERSMVVSAHGLIQSLLSGWFFSHEDEWKVRAGVEIRTRVSPTRVRLPDVIVDRAYKWPPVLTQAPLIVIEVLSPYDSYAETQRLSTDYQKMGVPNIWLIDPETKTGRVCEGPVWKEVRRFEVEGRAIYLELDWLFARLERYDADP